MVETLLINETKQIAFNCDMDNIPTWVLIDEINEILKQHNINAKFYLAQQNKYLRDQSGNGSMLIAIINDYEAKLKQQGDKKWK